MTFLLLIYILWISVTPISLNLYVKQFSFRPTLNNILNIQAPHKSINISNRPQKPFIAPDIQIKKNLGLLSRSESIWQTNKTKSNWAM